MLLQMSITIVAHEYYLIVEVAFIALLEIQRCLQCRNINKLCVIDKMRFIVQEVFAYVVAHNSIFRE